MKNTKAKITTIILSAVVAASAGAALAFSANASSTAASQAVSAADTVSGSAFIGRRLVFDNMTDSNGNAVNPCNIFGSSFRNAHEMYISKDGTFEIYLGAYKENKLCGKYVYNKASERFALSYVDGFNALAPVVLKSDGGYVINVPISVYGNIYSVEFSI